MSLQRGTMGKSVMSSDRVVIFVHQEAVLNILGDITAVAKLITEM